MAWSEIPIKILGLYFGNFVLANCDWVKIIHSLRKNLKKVKAIF